MTIFTNILNAFTGGTTGLAGDVMTAIEKYFPPDMDPTAKAQMQLSLQNLELQKTIAANQAISDAEKDVDSRISMYEGTAADLKGIPFLGPLLLTLRGIQRPAWGFATLYLDYGVFSGLWKLTDPIVSNAFWIVNFLVLGFLFGERAVTNVMPFVTNMLVQKNASAASTLTVTSTKN